MLAAIFMIASAVVVSAAKLEVKGSWRIVANYLDTEEGDKGATLQRQDDQFAIKSRARSTFQFVANEHLKAVTELQFFDKAWGEDYKPANPGQKKLAEAGATPGKKYSVLATKAYIEFDVQGINVQTGYVPFAVPSATEIFTPYDENAGGFVVAAPLNDMMSLDAAWMRTEQNRVMVPPSSKGSNDRDLFFAGLKVATDAYEFTPWLLFANYQENVKEGTNSTIENQMVAALSGKVNMDALSIATDIYFGKNKGKDAEDGSNFGGIVSVSMATDMMTPEFYVGYFGGQKKDKNNTIPLFAADVTKTTLLFDDSALGAGNIMDDYLNNKNNGASALTSSLFVGAALNNLSFVEGLSHTANVLYIKGNTKKDVPNVKWNENSSALTVDFNTKYQIYEQLALIAEIGYAQVEQKEANAAGDDAKSNLFGVTTGLKYSF